MARQTLAGIGDVRDGQAGKHATDQCQSQGRNTKNPKGGPPSPRLLTSAMSLRRQRRRSDCGIANAQQPSHTEDGGTKGANSIRSTGSCHLLNSWLAVDGSGQRSVDGTKVEMMKTELMFGLGEPCGEGANRHGKLLVRWRRNNCKLLMRSGGNCRENRAGI